MALKPVRVVNNFVAIIRHIEIPDGIEIPQEALEKISNEGIVCGIAKAVREKAEYEIGDIVIFTPRQYLALTPSSGGYADQTIILVPAECIVAITGKTKKFEFEALDAPETEK